MGPKNISTLIPDILKLVETGTKFDPALLDKFGETVKEVIVKAFTDEKKATTLRMSNLGTPCLRKLWYQLNKPEVGEALDGQTLIKFAYGHLVEALVLFLSEAAGHSVVGGQGRLEIDGVVGHRDAIIDGVLVDVKSASSYGFKKFAEHRLEGSDPFGYLDQINAYLFASQDDPALVEKQKAAFLAVDKTLGKMVLDEYPSNGVDYVSRVKELRLAMVQPEPPARYYSDVPEGKSGNRRLGVECSYCAFREECWPGLRTFAYSTGPKFFTHIEKAPRVEEAQGF